MPRKTVAILALATLLTACTPSVYPGPVRPADGLTSVARLGTVSVSSGSWHQHLAVDGDTSTWWSADDFAPQWLEVRLPIPLLVRRIELTVSQVEPGPATHKIRLENEAGRPVIWHRFDDERAVDGDTYTLRIDPPRTARKVRILTTRHPGWVAYRELRIFGGPTGNPMPQSVSLAAAGLSHPIFVTHAGDGSRRLFVVEQPGRIRIIKDGALMAEPFLDISHQVDFVGYLGLLGLAFPQDYAHTGAFYVSYTSIHNQNVLSRFSVGRNPDKAEPGSEEVLISYPQSSDLHTIGTLAFGPNDGYLYIASGDGHGTAGPPSQSPQETDTLYGSILRIDVSAEEGPYTIPLDNPFAALDGRASEIWAYGLRNPWGIAFDQDSGDMFIPDTGHLTREEVNYQPADRVGGQNYGWPCWEGDLNTDSCDVDTAIMPVVTYDRTQGCAIVGGAVRQRRFIYADFCTGRIWALRKGQTGWESTRLTEIKTPISSIGADEAGNLYAVGYQDGVLYRIDYHKTE